MFLSTNEATPSKEYTCIILWDHLLWDMEIIIEWNCIVFFNYNLLTQIGPRLWGNSHGNEGREKLLGAERECSRKLPKAEGETFQEYMRVKREAKKAIIKAWGEAIYGSFRTWTREKEISKLVQLERNRVTN